jgi:hypothetical protein
MDSHALPTDDLQRWQLLHRNGQRLLKLVDTLLDFSRIEAGRVRASYEPTDLALLTEDLASVFHSAIEAAGLRLQLRVEQLSEPVYVDREMWEKIVLTVAGYERKAMHYVVKVHVPGVAGAIASLLGKTPPDSHVWIASGARPSRTGRSAAGPARSVAPFHVAPSRKGCTTQESERSNRCACCSISTSISSGK